MNSSSSSSHSGSKSSRGGGGGGGSGDDSGGGCGGNSSNINSMHINFYAIVESIALQTIQSVFFISSLSMAIVAGCPGRCRLPMR
jgi:hypothetical protein